MTGEAAVRRAEDVGGQELSYAEVKAIASGNPAVLTLAEADAELQRLAVLKRNHTDEQFLARRRLRELPERIARLEGALAGLEADMQRVAAADATPVVIDGRRFATGAALDPLDRALGAVPDAVRRASRFPLGRFHGLKFGIELDPGGAADVYLEGQTCRTAILSKDARGPRAVLNALGRIASSYVDECELTRRELGLARTQLEDYQARLGLPFAHAAYLDALAGLRDRLRTALAAAPPAEGETVETAEALADQIKALRASNQLAREPVRHVPPRAQAPARRQPRPQVSGENAVVDDQAATATPDDQGGGPDAGGQPDGPAGGFRERMAPRGAWRQQTLF